MNEPLKYRPTIQTVNLWQGVADHVGSDRHVSLIDQLAACQSFDDEELLMRVKNSRKQEDVADDLGVSQQAVSYRYRRILRRANRCYCFGAECACWCHRGGQRRTDGEAAA